MADWRRRVHRLRYLWLVLPGLGLIELGAHLWLARRAPGIDPWRELAATVQALKQSGEPVVVAPEWAEPLARLALGDRIFPVSELARADDASVPRVLEIAELGARAPGLRNWPVVSRAEHGAFTLRVLRNPHPLRARYRFIEHIEPRDLAVAVVVSGVERPCEYTDHARVTAGGLHGEVAFPAERFQCPGGESMFVGVTIIDDQDYRPRRCIWAHPPALGVLRLRFFDVPLGSRLWGYAGLSYFLFRDGVGPPVTLAVSSAGRPLGATSHRDETGWSGFELSTAPLAASNAPVDFEIHADGGVRRDFCFSAEAVE